ncbi:MAG: hypothetical protein BWY65_01917 [Firmicutes bacterium ADurb.Bin373]|nr:MAG: hypothetical protein BWY65_01917 [Firmicutes bacterium ADurb.Bin373]
MRVQEAIPRVSPLGNRTPYRCRRRAPGRRLARAVPPRRRSPGAAAPVIGRPPPPPRRQSQARTPAVSGSRPIVPRLGRPRRHWQKAGAEDIPAAPPAPPAAALPSLGCRRRRRPVARRRPEARRPGLNPPGPRRLPGLSASPWPSHAQAASGERRNRETQPAASGPGAPPCRRPPGRRLRTPPRQAAAGSGRSRPPGPRRNHQAPAAEQRQGAKRRVGLYIQTVDS